MKKGFTLIELISVVIILGIILVIAVPTIYNIITNSRIETYLSNVELLKKATEGYLSVNKNEVPQEIGETKEINIEDIIELGISKKIRSPFTKEECKGYILVTKTEESKYDYTPHIDCINEIDNSVDDKLILHYKFNDFQEPTINLIPNSPINSYPKIGNTHATYNVNQYNSNIFFSIGTVESVSNNIVTLSSIGRAIYTYDVLRPETTGGGVTANTNYFIKKHSSNSFSLHQYNNSQDGSLGFTTQQALLRDQRIEINATNFPTMWHGGAHLPNSALVKEIIPNCFNNHECIRLNTSYKVDGAVDGMAYGVLPPVEQGKKYAFSFYYRAADQQTIGKTLGLSMHTGAGWPSESGKTITINSTDWKRYEITSIAPNTGGTNLYFWPSKGANVDISEIQVEQKDYSTPFTTTNREGIVKDYSTNSNNPTLNLNTTPKWIYDSERDSGVYEFNGINTYIDMDYGLNENLNDHTISLWVKALAPATNSMFLSTGQDFGANDRAYFGILNGKWDMGVLTNGWGSGTITANTNWNFITITFNGSQAKMYVNNDLNRTINYSSYTLKRNFHLGKHDSNYYFKGLIDGVRIYNRLLTEDEIELLYETTKKE